MAVVAESDEWRRAQRHVVRRLVDVGRRQPLGVVGIVIVAVMAAAAVLAPVVAPYHPDAAVGTNFEGPSRDFLFGTDYLGRDLFSRVIYGARVAMLVSVTAVTVGLVGGGLTGIVSGYFGGKVDIVIQRVVDIMIALPPLVLAIVLAAALGPSIANTFIAVGIALAPRLSRIVRSSTLSVAGSPYIEASKALGCGNVRVLMRHVLPNVFPIMLVLATSFLGAAVLIEASLSFLGMGVQPPNASWGEMLSGSSQQYLLAHPWLSIPPGIAIVVTVLGFNLLGDSLQETLDPRLRGGRQIVLTRERSQ